MYYKCIYIIYIYIYFQKKCDFICLNILSTENKSTKMKILNIFTQNLSTVHHQFSVYSKPLDLSILSKPLSVLKLSLFSTVEKQ